MYNKVIRLKEFIMFLKKNCAYEKYIYNLLQYHKTKTACVGFIVNDIDDTSYKKGSNLIALGFFWINTEEGYDYWFNLNKLWREKIGFYARF